MSGLAGQVRFDGRATDDAVLFEMSKRLAHRGANGCAVYRNQGVSLIWNRFTHSERNPSDRRIPFPFDGLVGVMLDGAILNAQALRAELEGGGVELHNSDDAILLIRAYARYGVDLFKKLDGMFAFVLVDLEKNKLYLVRDQAGMKPLYYHMGAHALSFASEIKALVKSGCVSASVDEAGLKEYLNLQLYIDERTLFRGVKAVCPGCYVEIGIEDGLYHSHSYWTIPEETLSISYEDAVGELKKRIESSVQRACGLEAPIGAFISGGLDSSIVATLASENFNRSFQGQLLTYASVFPDMRFEDERVYSDAVAQKIGSRHKRVRLCDDEVVAHHEELIYMLDMPCAGFSAPYRTLAKEVRKDVKIVMAGHGGDEYFCGYPKTIVAQLAEALSLAKKSGRCSFDWSLLYYLERFEPLTRSILGACLFADEATLVKAMCFRSDGLWNATRSAFRNRLEDYDLVSKLVERANERNTGLTKKMMHLDQVVELPGLLQVEDRLHMAENLETIKPLLSQDIIDFCVRLPDDFFLRNGLKGMFRSIGAPILPAIVANKVVKSGTMFPVQELFFGEMYASVKKKISLLDDTDWFAMPTNRLLEMDGVGQRDVWALWSLASWMESYL